jgi:hypothetical protein
MNTQTAIEEWMEEKLDRADNSIDVKTKIRPTNGKYIRTPWVLCKEIISEIARTLSNVSTKDPGDSHLWSNSLAGKQILVVDTVEFIPILLLFGAETCKITFIAPYVYKGPELAAKIKGVRVIEESLYNCTGDDFKDENNKNMKFDVIVGNPPYQDENRRPLTQKFIKSFFKFAKDQTGLVSMVGPVSWVNGTMPQSVDRNPSSSFSFINSHQVLFYNSNVTKQFNVGKDIGYWIALNKKVSSNDIFVVNGNDRFTVNTNGYKYLPYFLNKLNWGIFEKIQQKSKKYWSHFSFSEIDKTIPSVIFPKAQYTSFDKLCVFDGVDDSKLPTSKLTLLHIIPNGQINSAKIQFRSKLYRFIYNMVGGNSGCSEGFLRKFPMLENLQHENEIYIYFGLSKEEIDYVEAFGGNSDIEATVK